MGIAGDADEKKSSGKADRKLKKQLRAKIVGERAKTLKPLERRIRELENSIVRTEAELGDLYEAINAVSEEGDNVKIARLSREIHAREEKIGTFFERLEFAHQEYEKFKLLFEKRMEAFDSS